MVHQVQFRRTRNQVRLTIVNKHNIFKQDSKSWKIANLRYFKPIRAHYSGLIGENPKINNSNLEIKLDRKVDETQCHVNVINQGGAGVQSIISLPYPTATTGIQAVVGRDVSGNTIQHGQVIKASSETLTGATQAKAQTDSTGAKQVSDFFYATLDSENNNKVVISSLLPIGNEQSTNFPLFITPLQKSRK